MCESRAITLVIVNASVICLSFGYFFLIFKIRRLHPLYYENLIFAPFIIRYIHYKVLNFNY